MDKISVIVCTYTEKMVEHVLACIESINNQTLKPDEIILVLDPKERLVEFYRSKVDRNVKIYASSGFGLSFARNTGVKMSEGDIVVFIDDDAVANENWLEYMIKNYDDQNIIGVGGLSKPIWEYKNPIYFPEELYWIIGCSYKGLPKEKAEVRNPIGCNMSFRKKVFEEIGYFRTDIGRIGKKPMGDEETEFSIRVLEGFPNSRIIYDPQVIVHHRVRRSRTSLGYIWNRSFYEGIGKATIGQRLKYLSPLETENTYLSGILREGIPSRFRRFYEYRNVSQLLTLGFSTFAVLAGFLVGNIQSRVSI